MRYHRDVSRALLSHRMIVVVVASVLFVGQSCILIRSESCSCDRVETFAHVSEEVLGRKKKKKKMRVTKPSAVALLHHCF